MNVAITVSFAINPVIADTPYTQPFSFSCEPNPSGVNIGDINLPSPARIESPESR